MTKSTLFARRNTDNGFSLIELIVAVVIVGVLASIAVPAYINQQDAGREAVISSFLDTSIVTLKQQRLEGDGRYPAYLPGDIPIPSEVRGVSYTTSETRDAYCLALEYHQDSTTKQVFIRGGENGEAQEAQESCQFAEGIGGVILEGFITPEGLPRLTWTPIDGAATYEVWANGNKINTITDITFTGEALEQETAYTVVPVLSSGQRGNHSNMVTLFPLKSKPLIAPPLSIINVTTTDARATGTLAWSSVPWAEQYEVFNATTNESLWVGKARTLDISAAVGKSLSVYVVAFNDIGRSPNSNIVTLQGPDPVAPTLTSTLKDDDVPEGNTFTYTWNAIPGAATYDLYINDELIQSGATRTYTITYPYNTGIYNVHVIPVTESGRVGAKSNTLTWNSALAKPVGVTVSVSANHTTGNVTTTWNTPANTKHYEIETRKESTGSSVSKTTSPLSTKSRVDNIDYGDTFFVRVRPVGWAGGDWSSWQQVTINMPSPTWGTVTATLTGSTANATCPYGLTVQTTAQTNAGSSAYGSWLSWANGTSRTINYTPNYGQTARTNWRARCANNPGAGWKYSSEITRSVTAPIRTLPTPDADGYGLASDGWKSDDTAGGRVYLKARALFGSNSIKCPAGTELQSRTQVHFWNYDTPQPYTGWVSSSSLNYTDWRGQRIGWGNWYNFRMLTRCAYGSYYSPGERQEGTVRREAPIEAPTGLILHTNVYRTARWVGYCDPGQYAEYKWRKYDGNFPAAISEWTTARSTGNDYVDRNWGKGTHKIWVRCAADANNNVGPTSTLEVPY